jgi:two-component system, OmpR family, KDP operon response regulator KdpE
MTMSNYRVLIVNNGLTRNLSLAKVFPKDYGVFIINNDANIVKMVTSEHFDLLIIDDIKPNNIIYEIIKETRNNSAIPIAIINDWESVEHRVKCFNLGADEYIGIPFSLEELFVRCEALIRRSNYTGLMFKPLDFHVDNIKINFDERSVTILDKELKLTPIEFSILRELVLNSGKIITHGYLLSKVWGSEYSKETGYLYVHISNLRKKIETDISNPTHIQTIPYIGYRFRS